MDVFKEKLDFSTMDIRLFRIGTFSAGTEDFIYLGDYDPDYYLTLTGLYVLTPRFLGWIYCHYSEVFRVAGQSHD